MKKIKKLLGLVLLLLLALGLAACGGDEEPTETEGTETESVEVVEVEEEEEPTAVPEPEFDLIAFSDESGRFSIDLPTVPDESVEAVPTELGDLELYQFISEGDEVVYIVGYTDYPNDIPVDERLDGALDGALESSQASLESVNNVTYGDVPGRDFTATFPPDVLPLDDAIIHGRYYLVDQRLYQILILGSRAEVESDESNAVMESFGLTGISNE